MEILKEILNEETFISLTLSSPKVKSLEFRKIEVKLINIKMSKIYQVSKYNQTQVFHQNLNSRQIYDFLAKEIHNYKNTNAFTATNDYIIFSNRLNDLTVKRVKPSKVKTIATNNKEKKYLLKDGEFVPFLYELKVMNSEGKVNPSMYHKFKQVNRYLEFVDDISDEFPKDKVLNIIDFGCGKSYLTFALHHYFSNIKKRQVNIIGLDLKKDVIKNCNEICQKYHLENIHFLTGDIKEYDSKFDVDFVISLHACDVATDYALEKAIKWNAKVIFAVPCCQHEVSKMLKTDNLKAFTKYGIIQEKLASLITDTARSEILRIHGYNSNILEFIDEEDTPKNLLIRAVYSGKEDLNAKERLENLKKEFNFELTLEKLLK